MRVVAKIGMPKGNTKFSVNTWSTDQIFDFKNQIASGEREMSDLIIFPLYGKNSVYKGLTHIQILSEVRNFIRKMKFLLVIHLEALVSDHHYITILAKFLQNSPYFVTYNPEKLSKEIEKEGFFLVNTFSLRGVSFLLFQKK